MLESLPLLLKRLRDDIGFTPEEMAQVLGITTTELSCYESGERLPTFQLLETIVFVFEPDPTPWSHSSTTELCASATCTSHEQGLHQDYLDALDRAVDRVVSDFTDLHRRYRYPMLTSHPPRPFPINDQ